jgi:hypothetical protein
MSNITAYDVQKVIDSMNEEKDYALATIKNVVALIKRVYNWATDTDRYKGENPHKRENPASTIKLPKLNNEVTECLPISFVDMTDYMAYYMP